MKPGQDQLRCRAASLLAALALSMSAAPAQQHGEAVDATRTILDKWVETRRVIAEERRDWSLGKELLADRIGVMRREIESLRASMAETDETIAGTTRTRTELEQQSEALSTAMASVATELAALESRARKLLAQLPAPLRETVEPVSRGIPDGPDETRLSIGDRFLKVVFVLNAVNKFQSQITSTRQVLELAGGRSAQVGVVYLGLGQAFYVTAGGDAAGIGTPTPEGWTWRAADEHAAAIKRAVGILESTVPAAVVRLPIRVGGRRS